MHLHAYLFSEESTTVFTFPGKGLLVCRQMHMWFFLSELGKNMRAEQPFLIQRDSVFMDLMSEISLNHGFKGTPHPHLQALF